MTLRTPIRATVLAGLALSLAVGAAAPLAAARPAAPQVQAVGGLSEAHALTGMPGPRAAAATRTAVRATALRPRTARASAPVGSYAFSATFDGSPIRWDPCTTISWVSNLRQAPAGALPVLREAVDRIAGLTGTNWSYAGDVSTTPGTDYLPKTSGAYPPVLIGWADAGSSDLLAGRPGNVLGVTRTAWFGSDDGHGHRAAATRAAVIALDSAHRLPLRGGTSWKAVALHELGHAFGLDHVSDPTQLMHATLPRTTSDLQSGDQAGLARLGRSAGCVTVPGA